MTAGSTTMPTARSRLLRELRGEREQAGRTQREVAAVMDWSPSKIHRIETGVVGISTTDLKALLDYYNITDQVRVHDLIQLKREAEAARRSARTST